MEYDRRLVHARATLIGAFNDLLLTRRQRRRNLTVADIAATANVGLPSFYERYPNADAIYLDAVRHPFGALADAITGIGDVAALRRLLEDFWETRQRARDTFVRLDGQITRMAVDMVEERLLLGEAVFSLPVRLTALQLAEAALAAIRGWITGEAYCTPETLASAILQTSTAMREALSL